MKKLLLFIGILTAFTITQSSAQNKIWRPLSQTPYRGGVTHTATALDGKIYVTTNNVVYRSTDKGMTWREYPGSYGGNFSDLATYGSNTEALFVGTDWHMAWTLNGVQWRTQTFKVNSHTGLGGGVGKIHVDQSCGVLFSGNYTIQPTGNWMEILPEATISDYIFEIGKPILALAGGTQGGKIYQSDDGGLRWNAISDMPLGYGRLFKNGETIIAQLDKYEGATFSRIFLTSSDYGKSWTDVEFSTDGLSDPTASVTIQGILDGKIYASKYDVNRSILGSEGLFISTDNMKSWQTLHPAVNGALVNEIDFMYFQKNPTGDIVIVTNNRGVLYYDAKNNSLEERNNGLKSMNSQNVFAAQNSLFAFDLDGVVASHDGGKSWEHVSINEEKVQPQTALVMQNGDILLGSLSTKIWGNNMLYKSTDGGLTWQAADKGMYDENANWGRVEKLQYDKAGNIYASVFQNNSDKIFISTDGAKNWDEISLTSLGTDFALWDIAVKPNGEIIALGSRNFNSTPVFYRSIDDGRTWAEVTVPENLQLPLFSEMMPDRSGNIYVQNVFRNMIKFDGTTWTTLPESVKHTRFFFDNLNHIYQIPDAGNADWQGIKYSIDGGFSWEEITTGLPENADEYTITNLSFDNNAVYASLSDGTLYKLEQASSVNENPLKETISVTPNPATDNVTIAFKSDIPAKITVYSILGEVIYSAEISGSKNIDTKEFAPGVYHFTISSGNVFKTGSIVKK